MSSDTSIEQFVRMSEVYELPEFKRLGIRRRTVEKDVARRASNGLAETGAIVRGPYNSYLLHVQKYIDWFLSRSV